MILIGQYDSSFVRRVGIALTLYGLPFEHRPWSVFGDADRIAALNPLTRVPTLVLDDGTVLVDSYSMIDHIDGLVPAQARLFAPDGPERMRQMRVAALACGLADKGVALFYEQRLHEKISETWAARCRAQIAGTLAALEAERAGRTSTHLFGESLTHADIALACALRHVGESHPALIDWARHPALQRHCDRLEAMPVFEKSSQRLIPTA